MRHRSDACQGCGSGLTLAVKVPASRAGQHLTMTSCTQCEHRLWTSDAGTVSMQDVLRDLSGRRDFVAPAARPLRRSACQRGCAAS